MMATCSGSPRWTAGGLALLYLSVYAWTWRPPQTLNLQIPGRLAETQTQRDSMDSMDLFLHISRPSSRLSKKIPVNQSSQSRSEILRFLLAAVEIAIACPWLRHPEIAWRMKECERHKLQYIPYLYICVYIYIYVCVWCVYVCVYVIIYIYNIHTEYNIQNVFQVRWSCILHYPCGHFSLVRKVIFVSEAPGQ